MFESSQKTSLIDRLSSNYLLLVLILNELTNTNLLSFSLQVSLFPLPLPLMNFRFVYPLTINLVVFKLAFVSAAIHVLHYALSWFFAFEELSLVNHTFKDFLSAVTMWFRVMPLSVIWKYFAFEILSEFDEFSFPLKFTGFAWTMIVRSICVDKNGRGILSLAVNYPPIIDVIVAQNYKDRLVFGTRNLALLREIKRCAGGCCTFLHLFDQSLFFKILQSVSSRWVHQINKYLWYIDNKSISNPLLQLLPKGIKQITK